MNIKTKIKKTLKWCFENKKRKLIFSLFLILLIILPVYFVFFFKKSAEASWWNESWFYRKSIPVANSSGGTLTDFQLKILDNYDLSADITAGKIQADLDDIRFTTINGEILDYWIEDLTNNSVDVWLKIPSLPTSGATIYFYYGNSQATPHSDGNKVFDFFDDFNDNAIDSNKWTMTNFGEGGSYAETGGQLQLSSTNNQTGSATAKTLKNFTNNVVIEWKRFDTQGNYNDMSFGYGNITGESGTNYWHTFTYNGYFNKIQDNGDFQYIKVLNGVGTQLQSNINGPDASQWIKYKNIYSSAGPWQWHYDTGAGYNLLGTGQTDTAYLNNEKYILLARGGYSGSASGGTSKFDYIFVRKYASTQPTAGTFGTEEKSPAPVGYWSFDEGYGTVAHDESSNKNNGTITGATWKNENECLAGKCLYFDGTDDYVDLGNSNVTQFDGGTYDFSVSAWIKPNSATVKDRTIVGRWGNEDNNASWVLKIESDDASGKWAYHKFGSTYPKAQSSAQSIQIDKWYHLMGVKSGGEMRLYINGVLAATNSDTGSIWDSASNLLVGYGNHTDHFQGIIDEVKIYSYARTADQINQDYNSGLAGVEKSDSGVSAAFGDKSDKWLTDGLVGHWKMDEISGTTVADASGNGSNGVLTNAQETGASDASGNTTTTIIDTDGTLSTVDDAYNGMIFRNTSACGSIVSGTERLIADYAGTTKTFTISPALANAPDNCPYEIRHQVGGKYGNGIGFDGADDYVVIPDGASDSSRKYDLAKTYFTASAWIKIPILGSDKYIFSKKGSVNRGWVLRVTPTGEILFSSYGITNSTGKTAQNTIADTNWHHIVLVRSDSVFHLYLDGIEKTLVQQMVNMPDYGSGELHIGVAAPTSFPPTFFTSPYIDEARIYNRALSSDEAMKLYEYAPGPVLHMKMDEKVSGDAKTLNDSSGNSNTGTTVDGANNTGMDCSVHGKYGNACSFDGVDDTIGAGIKSSLDIKNSITLEAWIKPDTLAQTSNPEIISKSGGAEYYRMRFYNPGYVSFKTYGLTNTTLDGTQNVLTTNWNHVAMVYNGAYKKIYINGILNTSVAATGIMDGNSDDLLSIGGFGSAENFKGFIDDVKIYNYARTQEQILEDMSGGVPAIKSPVLNLSFDEGMGNVVHNSACIDASQCSSANGTLNSGATGTNATTSAMWDKNGKIGGAMEFDGADDYVNIANNGSLNKTDSITMTAWIKPSAFTFNGGATGIFGKGNAYYEDYFFGLNSGQLRFVVAGDWDGPNDLNSAANSISLNEWTHVSAVFNRESVSSSTLKFYINGKLNRTHTLAISDLPNTSSNVRVGFRGGNYPFNGLIDEVKFYNYALSEDEISTLYNGGNSISLGGEKATANNNGTTVTGDNAEYCISGDTAKCDKPVLELKMDEKSGTTAYDTSGNGNNGTLTGGTIWERGKVGGALSFDGSGDYVDVSGPTNFNFGNSDFSVDIWFKPSNISGIKLITGTFYPNEYKGWYIGASGNQVGVYASTTGFSWNVSIADSATLQKDNWYHYAFTRAGDVWALYRNGILVGSVNVSGSMVATSDGLDIGESYGPYNYAGLIDNVKIYNYSRTPAQIAWDYNRGKPVAHWRMDEGEGLVVHDESGNGNNGTMTNMDAATDWVAGKNNKALDFDGTDDYVNIGDKYDYSHASDFSMSAWIKTNDLSGLEHIMGRDYQSYRLFKDNGQLSFRLDSNSAMLNSGSILNVTDWFHIATTYDGKTKTAKIFVNGILKNENTNTSLDWTDAYQDFSIGNSAGGESYFFNGKIDDVKIYNYALTSEQVKQDYAGGAVNFK